MSWKKPDAALVERFAALLPAGDRAERRKMFGCPCAFVGGNMFAGVHEDRLIVRLPEARRLDLLNRGAAVPFSPGGRTMREYVAIEAAASRGASELAALVHEAFGFAARLPAKVKPAKRARPAARAPVRGSSQR